ncbi:hypothetical protein PO124_13225 [Bacillus licheniformis]|nr:hypothetical protein [Bacillus licheniformis]
MKKRLKTGTGAQGRLSFTAGCSANAADLEGRAGYDLLAGIVIWLYSASEHYSISANRRIGKEKRCLLKTLLQMNR